MLARCPKCPNCGAQYSTVILRKPTVDGDFIRRRRCTDCDHRWYTLQTAETAIDGHLIKWSKPYSSYTILNNETTST